MTRDRSTPVASAPTTVATLTDEDASEIPLDDWLRPGAAVSCVEDLPLLLGRDATSVRIGVSAGGRIVSHAATYRHRYRLPDGSGLEVGVIGAVATAPEHRRRGYGARCVRALQRSARESGVDVVVLWDEGRSGWYSRFGFLRAGRETLHVATRRGLSHLVHPDWVRPIEPRDLDPVRALHDRERASTVRTRDMWLRLLSVPRTETWVLERKGEIEAYGVLGKGNDLQQCVHEWSGVECALPALLSGIFSHRRDLDELAVMSPPWKAEARRAMAFQGLAETDGVLGMIWLPDAPALATRLAREDLTLRDHDGVVRALFDRDDGIPFYLRGLDSM